MDRSRLVNLFADLAADPAAGLDEERVDPICEGRSVRIERIISRGQGSPHGFWYDQCESEWVMVVRGRAELLLEGDAEPIAMGPGDHLLIPAGRRHRVESTSDREPTIWLAVFFQDEENRGQPSADS